MGFFDDMLNDPETRLMALHELIEALQLHVDEEETNEEYVEDNSDNVDEQGVSNEERKPRSKLIEMESLVNVLIAECYCPTTTLLVIRAMNALLDIDPAFAMDQILNITVVERIMNAAMTMQDVDLTEHALKWCYAMARNRPSWFLHSGAVYFFLTTQTSAPKKKCLELAICAVNVELSKENASAILSLTDIVVEYLNDADDRIAELAMKWTIEALNALTEHSYLAAYVHDTTVVSAWLAHFSQLQIKTQCQLLVCVNSILPVCSYNIVMAWAELISSQCFALRHNNLRTYDIKAAALPILVKMASLQPAALLDRPPYVLEWSCTECTMFHSTEHSFCQVCGAPRIPLCYEGQQLEWYNQKFRYNDIVDMNIAIETIEDAATMANELASRFACDVMYFLKNEARGNALWSGIKLYANWITQDDEAAWSEIISVLSLLSSTHEYDSYIEELLNTWEATIKLEKTKWTALLHRNGFLDAPKSHELFTLVKALEDENDDNQYTKIYNKISTIDVPTPWEVQASGWLNWLMHHNVELTPERIAAIDNQFVSNSLELPLEAWDQTPMQLRLWKSKDAFVDVLAHPLMLMYQVVASMDQMVSTKTDSTLVFTPDIYLTSIAVQNSKLNEQFNSISMADTVLGTVVKNAIADPSLIYEVHLTNNSIAPTRLQCIAKNPSPRLTQALADAMEEEWRIATRTLPDAMKLTMSTNPAGVPLNLRSKFFLGSKATRATREKFGGRTTITVSRVSLQQCTKWVDVPPQQVLYVAFAIEAGHGIGPTTEFYTALSRTFLDKSLWRDPEHLLYPAPNASTDSFHLLGRAFGRAFLDGYKMDLQFSIAMIKLLQQSPLDWNDLLEFDLSLHKSIKCLEESQDAEAFGLYFNLPGSDNYPLVENGCDRFVTNANRDEYIALVKQHILHDSVQNQISAFLSGFEYYLPANTWRYFTPTELQVLLHSDAPWRQADLESGLICRSGYTNMSPVIQWLIITLSNFDSIHRGLFLKFVTGSPCLPLGGWPELALTVVPTSATDSALPSCNTCQKYLKLPKYSSKNILEIKLTQAITEGQAHFALD
ncbi:hypothetical protein THRCLA_03099 [Thraustotheca clavata]|uniref:HECT E3 ubiquitin ligase n=1 Tax=Thraustotheca clavata TaxID=74557 RepID=A0A1W0A346_9STRA|nr:hypothetical protein THRCLA_03099 [Thraustotheca clavata]